MNLDEVKLQQVNAIATYRAYGHAVDLAQDAGGAGRVVGRRPWIPIRPCLCVQDSPQNPCPCDSRMLWWLWGDAVIAQGDSGRKDHDGKELQFFDVLVESKIMVESLEPVNAGALQELGNNLNFERVRELTCGTGGIVPGAMESRVVWDFLIGIIGNLVADAIKGEGPATRLDRFNKWIQEGKPWWEFK